MAKKQSIDAEFDRMVDHEKRLAKKPCKPQHWVIPNDWKKMPIGFYLRLSNQTGRWMIGGQKSELPLRNKSVSVYGPLDLFQPKS